jgi:hypothetical protein
LYRLESILWLLCLDAEQTSDATHEIVCQITEQLDREMMEGMGKDD